MTNLSPLKVSAPLNPGFQQGTLAKLTCREREALALLGKGFMDKEIAQAMGISIWTVHFYIKNIFKRLNVHTRTEAAIQYVEISLTVRTRRMPRKPAKKTVPPTNWNLC